MKVMVALFKYWERYGYFYFSLKSDILIITLEFERLWTNPNISKIEIKKFWFYLFFPKLFLKGILYFWHKNLTSFLDFSFFSKHFLKGILKYSFRCYFWLHKFFIWKFSKDHFSKVCSQLVSIFVEWDFQFYLFCMFHFSKAKLSRVFFKVFVIDLKTFFSLKHFTQGVFIR